MSKLTNGVLAILGEIAVTTAGTPSVGANTSNAFDFQNVILADGTRGNRSMAVVNGGSVVLPGVYRDAIVNAFNLLNIGQATPGGSPNLGGYMMVLQQSNEAPFVTATLSNANHTTFRTLAVGDPTGVSQCSSLEAQRATDLATISDLNAQLEDGGTTPGVTPGSTSVVVESGQSGPVILAALSGIMVGQLIGRGVVRSDDED